MERKLIHGCRGNSLIISLLHFSRRSFLHYWAQGFLVAGPSDHYSYNIYTIEHVTFCHFKDCASVLIRTRVERLIDTWLVFCFFFFFFFIICHAERRAANNDQTMPLFFYPAISLWLSFVMKRVQRTML